MTSVRDRLRDILLRDKFVTPEALQKAIDHQKKTGGDFSKILIELNIIDEDTLLKILSEALNLPTIKMAKLKIPKNALQAIPRDVAKKYQLIPVSLMDDSLTLAMADPANIFVIDNIKSLTGLRVTAILASPKEIEDCIQKYYFEGEGESGASSEKFNQIMQDIKDVEDLELIKDIADSANSETIEELTDEAPIIKLTDAIIQQSVLNNASDVFIEPMDKFVRIRYRIDGVIREIDRMAKALCAPMVSRIKIISNLDISEHRLPQDGRFKTKITGNREVDFRVSVLPTILGEKVVLRVLDQEGASALDIEKLGFEPKSLERLKECVKKPHGMILTCGPTGSGKTTTLYSILKYVDSPGKNIVTVEDPVEYQMKGLNQVNVRPSMGLTFATSLRSILRQDPNIIMIGEIRDSETLDIAVKAALTGHLVISSLHTTTATGSVVRMMNMGVEPFLICSSVLAIVAQRLLRKICEHCKESYVVPSKVVEDLKLDKAAHSQKIELFRGKGCNHCLKMGYKGRVGITEVLVLTPEVKELILSKAGEFKIKKLARSQGMLTMREDAVRKAVAGLTTLEEVLRVTAPDEE